MTIGWRTLPAVPLAGLLIAGAAQAETRAQATVSADAGYGTNPFLSGGSNQDTGTLTGRFAPMITFLGPKSNVNVSGRVEHIVFTDHYKDMTNWSLGSAATFNLSPRSQLGLNASYSSQVQNSITDAVIPSQPDPIIDPSTGALAGTRIKTASGGANYSTSLSARNTLSVEATVSKVDYGSTSYSGASYTSYGGSVGLSHAIGQKASVGASVAYSRSDYESALYGNFSQISPSLNATVLLAPRVTLTASAGASFTRIEQFFGTSNSVHFSGQINLCHDGDRAKACVAASRSLGSTAGGGTSTLTTASANYAYKLTPHSNINASVQYTESKSLSAGSDYGYAVANVSYQRDLGRRLSVSATARYTEPFKSAGGRAKGFYGGIGVNYRLGR